MKNKPQLIAFMNSYSHGKSGGDVVFIEIAKRIKNYNKVIITSFLGKKLCQENSLKGRFLITTQESEFENVTWIYIKRIIKAFFLKLQIQKKDIFIGTSDFLPDILPIFWLKRKNKKTKWIQHVFHLIPFSRKIPFFTQRISFVLIKQLADLIIVDNNFLKKDLIKLGFDSKRIFVNYPGISFNYLKSIKAENRVGYDGVFMGQLRFSKGIFDLVEIWRLVCQEKPKARLGIIGKGNKETLIKLKKQVEKEKLEKNIDILGYLPDNIAFSIIKSSHVFVFPSHEEGFGITPLEVQSLGLPVVAWNLPVFDEVFKNGMVKVEINKKRDFSDKVIKLLRNRRLYQELSKLAMKNASQYDWDKVAEKELKIWKNN